MLSEAMPAALLFRIARMTISENGLARGESARSDPSLSTARLEFDDTARCFARLPMAFRSIARLSKARF
jgi:hypothetical protein